MAETSPERIATTDQLPDDPLQMPPPYWRGSGAVFHIEAALADLVALLHDLVVAAREHKLLCPITSSL
jgi:hypothetical protein